jgi:transposase InsO family protein
LARKRYSSEQIIHLLREAEIRINQGTSVAETCRQIGVNIQTYYRWRGEYGGMEIDQLRRLKQLEQENGYNESFNVKLRDELLNGEVFTTLLEAQVLVEAWRQTYNRVRPHSSLGYRPPAPETVASPLAAAS